jgi:16S rRNA (cytosine967-C5)-methyltransferase
VVAVFPEIQIKEIATMTPSARIKTAIEILEKINVSRVPMDSTIGDYMRFRKYIGAKDRAAIVELVYNVMRCHARLGWYIDRAGSEDRPRTRVLFYLVLTGNKDVSHLFDGSKYGPEELSEDEIKLIKMAEGEGITHKDMPAYIECECPRKYEEVLTDIYGDDFKEELGAMLIPASLDLRVNTWLAEIDKVRSYLAAAGIETDPTQHSKVGLRARGKAFISRTKAFGKGWIEIQDEGSQLIARACDARPGMNVLDYCAGAGGKTLAIAAEMKNKGRIVAMDIDPRRLEKARPRFKKAGVHDIIEVRPISDTKNRKWLRRQKATFDVVLTDVPCSGTGTWRRNPDMRWRQYGPDLEELLSIQAEILDKVAKTVKTGGHLIYATCSLLPAENEDQVKSFIARHENFIIDQMPEGVPAKNHFMRLTPLQHHTDGFFAARLKKVE